MYAFPLEISFFGMSFPFLFPVFVLLLHTPISKGAKGTFKLNWECHSFYDSEK